MTANELRLSQAPLFPDIQPVGNELAIPIVNVATVPQRSPFRYPGGKTWLIPRIRTWLSPAIRQRARLSPDTPDEFIEPFAGGGIVSLTVAAERLARHVTMVELDADVASVWQTALDADGAAWLAQRVRACNLTYDYVSELLAETPRNIQERAFKTIVRNRVLHGGILAPGSGLLKRGENGRGIRSRWYPETLARRILLIATLRHVITFIAGDGLAVIAAHANNPGAVFFFDPPYTMAGTGKRAGKRLYAHNELDHDALFALAAQVRGDFLMTYDTAAEVTALAARYKFEQQLVPMKNTHHAKMTELLIGPHLDWISANLSLR